MRAYDATTNGEGALPVAIMIYEFYRLNEGVASKADGLAKEGCLVGLVGRTEPLVGPQQEPLGLPDGSCCFCT